MEPTYTIAEDGKSITCNLCGLTSHHPKDVENKFCGHCGIFHEDAALAAGTSKADTSNYFAVVVSGQGEVMVMRPVMGAIGRARAINLAVWLKLLADPGGAEFARVEREVRKT